MLHQYQVEIKKAGLLRGGPPKESDSLTDPPILGPDGSPSSSENAKGKSRPVQTERGGWIVPLTARDGNEKAPIKLENSTALSRRILIETLKTVQNDLPPLATDGGSLLLSFAPIPDDKLILPIRVSPDCDSDDPYIENSKKEWFIVTLTKTGMIDFAAFNTKMPGQDKFRQSLDVIIKHSLDRIGLKSFGKSPRVFYFDDKIQPSLLGNTLNRMYQNLVSKYRCHVLFGKMS